MVALRCATALVVAERGSDWGCWLDVLRDRTDELILVVQQAGESAERFARRSVARVARAGRLCRAALMFSKKDDDGILAARLKVARALLPALEREALLVVPAPDEGAGAASIERLARDLGARAAVARIGPGAPIPVLVRA